jgi:hypothetical protein
MGEIAAVDAIRETCVILDPGCRTRLPSGAQTVKHEGRKAFGGRVDSRSETRGASPENQNVINRIRQLAAKTKVIRELGAGGCFKEDPAAVSHDRIGLNIFANMFEFDPVVVERRIQPLVRHAVAEQQLHGFECCPVVFPSVDAQAAEFRLEQ